MSERPSAIDDLERRIEIARGAIGVAESMAASDPAAATKLTVQLEREIAEFESMIEELKNAP